MGVATYTEEYTYRIPPVRLFKVSILDCYSLIPKLILQAIKSIEIIRGSGGAGSIKQINFAKGSTSNCVKHRIDGLNEDTFTTTILRLRLMLRWTRSSSKLLIRFKFEPSSNGGTVSKVTSKFYTKGDFVLTGGMIKSKGKAGGMYKVVEAYLLQNPSAHS